MKSSTLWSSLLVLVLLTGVIVELEAIEPDASEAWELMDRAISRGDVAGAALLLDRGMPVDLHGLGGRTALMEAVSGNKSELVRLFLARGADPFILQKGRWSLWDHLHVSPGNEKQRAISLEIFSLLLETGLPIDTPCDKSEGDTLLMKVCKAGDSLFVARLLEEGASIALRDNERGRAALEFLVEGVGFWDRKEVSACLTLLLGAGADPREYRSGRAGEESRKSGLWGFLQDLAKTGDAMAMNMILNRFGGELSADSGKASAVLADFLPKVHGDAVSVRAAVEALVALGAAGDVKDTNGKPAIFGTCHPEAVLALLDTGFPATITDDCGRNLLVHFLYWKRTGLYGEDFLRGLVQRGVAVNQPDREGETALFHCREPGLVALLLDLGADPAHINAEGETALHRLAIYNADPLALRLLLDAGAPLEAFDKEGNSPFTLAAALCSFEAARFLADRGADVFHRNLMGEGALDLLVDYLVRTSGRSGYRREAGANFIRLLLDCGLDPAHESPAGVSPLLAALRSDPVLEESVAMVLVGAVSKDELGRARKQLARERRQENAETLREIRGPLTVAISVPLVICGLSIGLREGVYAGIPYANWMVGVNSFLVTTGGLFAAGGLAGVLLGYILFNDKSVTGMGAIGIGIGIAGMAGLGAIVGGIIGCILSFQPDVLAAFADSAFLYYVPSGLSLIIPVAVLKRAFQ